MFYTWLFERSWASCHSVGVWSTRLWLPRVLSCEETFCDSFCTAIVTREHFFNHFVGHFECMLLASWCCFSGALLLLIIMLSFWEEVAAMMSFQQSYFVLRSGIGLKPPKSTQQQRRKLQTRHRPLHACCYTVFCMMPRSWLWDPLSKATSAPNADFTRFMPLLTCDSRLGMLNT